MKQLLQKLKYLLPVCAALMFTGVPLESADARVERLHDNFKYSIYISKWSKVKHRAELGDPDAQFQLGNQYYKPTRKSGFGQSYPKAVEWYGKAAMRNHTGAQHNLAVMYEHGLGVKQDLVSAYSWYMLAAGSNNPAGKSVAEKAARAMTALESELSETDLVNANKYAERILEKMVAKDYFPVLKRAVAESG